VEGNGVKVLIDPFLTGNPLAAVRASDVQCDAILLTHGHNDHFGDTIEIARANKCPVISSAEIASYCTLQGVEARGMNIGGSYQADKFRVKFTQAFHSSSLDIGGSWIYMGMPMGILLTMDGTTFYHAGDTGLFGDLKMIGEMNTIDVAALPIGDNFTMGPSDAVIAAQWLRTKNVIPVHYNTFEVIKQDPHAFAVDLAKVGIKGHVLKPGEAATF
jgi:L-ascorbate metabolism protein UlaG (beta-lactamase superfamily)